MAIWTETAPAKVNLFLHVTGKRADGYHLLDSLFAFTGSGDRLRYRHDPTPLTLSLTGPYAATLHRAGSMEDNLVLKAGRKLAELAGQPTIGEMVLEKHLPVASGIGGGSADAAAALRLLMRAWNIAPEPELLNALALELGADVPACLTGRACRVNGIGEELTQLKRFPKVPILLINPGVPVSTPAVFKNRTGAFSAPATHFPDFDDVESLAGFLRDVGNDLTLPAVRIAPVVGQILGALSEQPGCLVARMSGSGATCFGLFENIAARDVAARELAVQFPGAWELADILKPTT